MPSHVVLLASYAPRVVPSRSSCRESCYRVAIKVNLCSESKAHEAPGEQSTTYKCNSNSRLKLYQPFCFLCARDQDKGQEIKTSIPFVFNVFLFITSLYHFVRQLQSFVGRLNINHSTTIHSVTPGTG